MRRPEALGLGAEAAHQLGALDPVGEARVVLDVARDHQLAAGLVAGDDDRGEVGPRGVDRGGQAGRAGADDDDVRLAGAIGGNGDRRGSLGRLCVTGGAEVDREAAEGGGGFGHGTGWSRAGWTAGTRGTGRYRSTAQIPRGSI